MAKFNPKSIYAIAKKEFLDNIRNKWIILLTIIFFMLLTSMGANILGISLPFASFPNPSHLGLDGVSPTNYIAGRALQ